MYDYLCECSLRVSFGLGWLDKLLMEIYKEDIVCFWVLLDIEIMQDSIEQVFEKKVLKFKVFQVYNFIVYCWNCFCYGISDNGKLYLCIENWVFFAGFIIVDEIVNVVFWIGVMIGMVECYDDICDMIVWEDVCDNFGKVVKFGIDIKLNWFDDYKIGICELVLKELFLLV